MKKKKMKKKPKILIIILVIILVIVGFILIPKKNNDEEKVEKVKVVAKIEDYGYNLKEDKSKAYKKLFKELQKELSKEKVDEKEYAKIITKMFIVDFYSLNDRKAKTDIGGVDFVHESALENFVLNAEDTFYKYVESNIYGGRKQDLPTVDKIKINEVKNEEYSYLEEIDENAFIVDADWTYKDESKANGYQTKGIFTFVHVGKKLCLVEISE